MFTEQSMEKVDKYTRVSIVFWNVNRWVSVRIQVCNNDLPSSVPDDIHVMS
jgi:hypothetical protein